MGGTSPPLPQQVTIGGLKMHLHFESWVSFLFHFLLSIFFTNVPMKMMCYIYLMHPMTMPSATATMQFVFFW